MYFDETIKKIESNLEKLQELDRMLDALKTVMEELMESADLHSAEIETVDLSKREDQI